MGPVSRLFFAAILIFGALGFAKTSELEKSEVRCGTLAKKPNGKFVLDDCMIARPPLGRPYDLAAGWNICMLTRVDSKADQAQLQRDLGKQICMQGEHQGQGQFRFGKFVSWENRYDVAP